MRGLLLEAQCCPVPPGLVISEAQAPPMAVLRDGPEGGAYEHRTDLARSNGDAESVR